MSQIISRLHPEYSVLDAVVPLYKIFNADISSNTGYTLEKRKDRPSFKPEVAKVLENFAGSYQEEILTQKQIKNSKSGIYL